MSSYLLQDRTYDSWPYCCNGVLYSEPNQQKLWDKYYTSAPEQRRQLDKKYSIHFTWDQTVVYICVSKKQQAPSISRLAG